MIVLYHSLGHTVHDGVKFPSTKLSSSIGRDNERDHDRDDDNDSDRKHECTDEFPLKSVIITMMIMKNHSVCHDVSRYLTYNLWKSLETMFIHGVQHVNRGLGGIYV